MIGAVLWITGLPGSGKSTYADEIKRGRPDTVVLRMDELRRLATPEPSYTDDEREVLYRSLVFAAITLSQLGHDVIIDATGNRRRWRELARQEIACFGEVYLKCPLELCMSREDARKDTHSAPGHIYEGAGKGGGTVPGLGAPYEEPLHAELVIDSANEPLEAGVESVLNLLDSLKAGKKGND